MRLILTCTHTCSKVIHNVLLAQEVFQKDAPPAYEQDGPAPVAFNFDRQIRLYGNKIISCDSLYSVSMATKDIFSMRNLVEMN